MVCAFVNNVGISPWVGVHSGGGGGGLYLEWFKWAYAVMHEGRAYSYIRGLAWLIVGGQQ